MAVYKRTYRGYSGPLTSPAWRFTVLQRYAFRAVFKSRLLLIGYVACFFAPLALICALYLNQNATLLAMVNQKVGFLKVDSTLFLNFLSIQGVLAGILTAFVGPSLVAPDLTNGALSVYLSRPFTRSEYILGKGMVLGSLIASITLLPGLLAFAVQSSLVGWQWFIDNFYLGFGTLLSCLILMSVLMLMGLAMSAFVRWKIVAGALILASFAAGKGFAAVINEVMRTQVGTFLDIQQLLSTVSTALLHGTVAESPSPWAAAVALIIFCGLLLMLINRKLRVCEVAG
jgi:ABC-2 type transport system permease protein